jgi:hypothetical protein
MLQRNRHFGKLRDPEELVVRGQLRYLADVPRNFGVSRVVVS